ncbi:hypothetical protein [Spiroplasma floricola]|uniref:Lipoprotein n=1 Tax=Spiroplasma floricola 23-6 TaxID=1336749 RepID=A0A2K8SEH2_9MOLU|nr:hypothetical protein [Spiroplasma floricola]AUB31755.1 hypothetical protein SFLOR_v1c07070 [Spiroplasma floricola 23-6]
MKRLLSFLTAFCFISSSTIGVAACSIKSKNNSENSKKDITQIVQDFEQDVTKIWSQHYEKEVRNNLIALESMEEKNEFLNKYNIQKFSKPENKDKLTSQNKQQLTNDVEKLFKSKLLEEKLSDLKKVSKYKVILDEIDSVFEHVELIFNDNFQINSGEIIPGVYIGNVIIDYKIITKYKGLNNIEKFIQSGTLKYTSTDNDTFKEVGEVMYKNIAKDMFTSQETKDSVILKWNNVKQKSSNDLDGYIDSNTDLKLYFDGNKDFHQLLLNTIKKYFNSKFPSLEIRYDKKNIYKTSDFVKENKDYLIINNIAENKESEESFNLTIEKDKKEISKILQGDEESIKFFLLDKYYSNRNISKIRDAYLKTQNEFLTKFLNKNEISEYQKSDSYKLAIAIGYIEFIGPSIKIGKEDSFYNHQMPDFKLIVTYSINGNNEQIQQPFSEFGMRLFDIYKQVYKPNANVAEKEERYGYSYVFGLYFDNYLFSKEQFATFQPKTNSDINEYLKKFDSVYYTRMKELLSKTKGFENIFKNKDIIFTIKATNENLSYEQQRGLAFLSRDDNNAYLILSKWTSNTGDKIFKELEYIEINLFGLIKIKVYFDKNVTYSKGRFILF